MYAQIFDNYFDEERKRFFYNKSNSVDLVLQCKPIFNGNLVSILQFLRNLLNIIFLQICQKSYRNGTILPDIKKIKL